MKATLALKINSMTPDELYEAVYKDPVTEALNRRAWDEIGSEYRFMVLIDLDSLKYVNDTQGHRTGDKYLKGAVTALSEEFGDAVYRLSGDEFAVSGRDPEELVEKVRKVQEVFPLFSFGAGDSIEDADKQLSIQKSYRLSTGHRANRGERPPWINQRGFNLCN